MEFGAKIGTKFLLIFLLVRGTAFAFVIGKLLHIVCVFTRDDLIHLPIFREAVFPDSKNMFVYDYASRMIYSWLRHA